MPKRKHSRAGSRECFLEEEGGVMFRARNDPLPSLLYSISPRLRKGSLFGGPTTLVAVQDPFIDPVQPAALRHTEHVSQEARLTLVQALVAVFSSLHSDDHAVDLLDPRYDVVSSLRVHLLVICNPVFGIPPTASRRRFGLGGSDPLNVTGVVAFRVTGILASLAAVEKVLAAGVEVNEGGASRILCSAADELIPIELMFTHQLGCFLRRRRALARAVRLEQAQQFHELFVGAVIHGLLLFLLNRAVNVLIRRVENSGAVDQIHDIRDVAHPKIEVKVAVKITLRVELHSAEVDLLARLARRCALNALRTLAITFIVAATICRVDLALSAYSAATATEQDRAHVEVNALELARNELCARRRFVRRIGSKHARDQIADPLLLLHIEFTHYVAPPSISIIHRFGVIAPR